jgi:hypothetical protein
MQSSILNHSEVHFNSTKALHSSICTNYKDVFYLIQDKYSLLCLILGTFGRYFKITVRGNFLTLLCVFPTIQPKIISNIAANDV